MIIFTLHAWVKPKPKPKPTTTATTTTRTTTTIIAVLLPTFKCNYINKVY